MQIIKMAGKIGLIADSMFPKVFCQSLRLPPIKYWKKGKAYKFKI